MSGLRYGVGLAAFLAVAGYFLWAEHEVHIRALFPYWPWLILLACPLIHVFMHGGHGHGHDRDDSSSRPDKGKSG